MRRNTQFLPRQPNMKNIREPPLPANVVLTDRADGTLWHLSFTTTPPGPDGLGYITLNSALPVLPNKDIVVYGAWDGPVMSMRDPRNGLEFQAQLLVRGGYLGFEVDTDLYPITGRSQARVMARRSLQKSGREIIFPGNWPVYEALAWVEVDFHNG